MNGRSGRLSALRGWARRRAFSKAAATVPVVVVVALGVGWLTAEDRDPTGEPVDFSAAVASAARTIGLEPPTEPKYSIAHPTGPRVDLHDAPGGEVIERVGPRTEFGSPRRFFVGETRGDWVGVVTPELPNGELSWLDLRSGQVQLTETSYSIRVKLSGRSLEIRDGNRLVHRARVSIGRAGHSTPTGRFAVTDALAGRGLGPWYGCCALAISGHQPNLPTGWVGGDRIAIHGTPGPVGEAVSTGCVRTSDEDMVALFATVPLGAPVFISK